MNEFTAFASEIKSRVTMTECARFYGLTINHMGFAQCPFHSERTPSLKVHEHNAHCFGCGWSGTVIDFVMNMFNLEFAGAVRKINNDFLLHMPIDRKPTLREQREAEQRQRELSALREHQEAERIAYDNLYNALWDTFARLDKQRIAYKPKRTEEEINPLYIEAVTRISYIEYLIDDLL